VSTLTVTDLPCESCAEIVAPDDQAVAAEKNSAFPFEGPNREIMHSVRCQVELGISQQLDATSATESVPQEFNLAASPTVRSAVGVEGGIGGGRVRTARTAAECQEPFSEVSGDHSSVNCNITITSADSPTAKCAKIDRSPGGAGCCGRIDY